jgi:long-chain acyl-CoA synthetase
MIGSDVNRAADSDVVPEELDLRRVIRDRAARHGDRKCLIASDRTVTWRQLYERSSALAQALLASGVQTGDRVLYIGKNDIATLETVFAAALSNAVFAAVNWRLSASEISEIIAHAKPKVVITESDYAQAASTQMVVPADAFAAGQLVVLVADKPATSYASFLSSGQPVDPCLEFDRDSVALQVYTSGTTGLPKGAVFTHRAIAAANNAAKQLALDEDAVALVAMPMFHCSGLSFALAALAHGGTCAIAASARPDAIVADIAAHGVTTTMLVPTVLPGILDAAAAGVGALASLKRLAYVGAPIDRELLNRALAVLGPDRLVNAYGASEIIAATMLLPQAHLDERRRFSVGRALPGVTIKIVTEDGNTVGDNVTGEILIRGPSNTLGYADAPEHTRVALTEDGYFRTGDGGYLDDGWLYLADRIKDMIITGGENVYSVEVESVLAGCPGVLEVAVIGLASAKWGETVHAVVVSDGRLTARDIIDFATKRLASYKCPKAVSFVESLPRTATGKVRKHELREMIAAASAATTGLPAASTTAPA